MKRKTGPKSFLLNDGTSIKFGNGLIPMAVEGLHSNGPLNIQVKDPNSGQVYLIEYNN